MRQAWGRLIHKQWLIVYPLALGVISTVAFLAVYASTGLPLTWSGFFRANYERWQFVRDNLVSGLDLDPALGIAVAVGLGLCILTAMIRAPYFRAIVGPRYPRAPRNSIEAARLALFYLFINLVVWVLPFAGSSGGFVEQFIAFVVLVIVILVVFADYVIVFEDVGVVAGIRRSLNLLVRRWVPVVVIFIVLQLIYFALYQLYSSSYENADGVLILLPLVQIVIDAFIVLVVDLLLIFLYEKARRGERA